MVAPVCERNPPCSPWHIVSPWLPSLECFLSATTSPWKTTERLHSMWPKHAKLWKTDTAHAAPSDFLPLWMRSGVQCAAGHSTTIPLCLLTPFILDTLEYLGVLHWLTDTSKCPQCVSAVANASSRCKFIQWPAAVPRWFCRRSPLKLLMSSPLRTMGTVRSQKSGCARVLVRLSGSFLFACIYVQESVIWH